MRFLLAIAAFAAMFTMSAAPVSAQSKDIWRTGADISLIAKSEHDVWAAGALVDVKGTVAHQLHVAGAQLDVDATTGGDAYIAGAVVSVKGNYRRDLYVGGATVSIAAHVAGKLKAAGAQVLVGPQTTVPGDIRLAGAHVVFSGIGGGKAEIYGDTVEIDGRIAGDVLVRARNVSIGKDAVLAGNVVLQTLNEPVIAPGARLLGHRTVTTPPPQERAYRGAEALVGAALFGVAAGFLAGLMLLIVRRSFVERAIAALRARPGHSFGLGVLILILLPLVTLILLVTVIGVPTALLLLLALPLLLFVGTIIGAFAMGDFMANREGRPSSFIGRLWQLLVGLVVLGVIGIIPYVGIITWLAALIVGLGVGWQGLTVPPPAPKPVAADEAVD